MRTKYILGALCLPGIFAACTNEDFLTENENQLAGKETVKMVLSANYGTDGQADTKMVNQNGTFLWDNTDELGATLLAASGNAIYSNNKFVNTLTEPQQTGVDFTTNATTVVGNYLFYYPYSTKMTTNLDGVQYSLKEPQVYDPTGEEMMKNNFMIAPKVEVDGSEPGTLTLPITMRSIYGYGLLNLAIAQDNPNYTELYVQKVIIEYTSNVYKDGYINMANVPAVDLTADNLEGLAENEKYEGMSTAEIRKALLEAADLELTARELDDAGKDKGYAAGTILGLTAQNGSNGFISQVSISCLSDENPNGIKVTKDGGFSTRVLLPTTGDAGAGVTVTVYTNKGSFEVLDEPSGMRIKPGHTINLANINRTDNGKEVFTLSGEADEVTAINAISEADFIQSMKAVSGASVNVSVGNFELTAAAINAIPSGVTVDFDNEDAITFNGNMTLKKMTFDGPVKLKGGDITVNDDVELIEANTITIDGANVVMNAGGASNLTTTVNSGTLTVTDSFTSNIDVNGGTVNLGKAKATAAINTYLRYVNKGTVNVNGPINNGGVAIIVGSSNGDEATLNVNANVTASAGITVNKGGKVVNNATLTIASNKGTINAEAGNLTVTTNEQTQGTGAAAFTPVINYNGGEASVETNNGIIYNNVKAVDGTLKITLSNTGLIYVVAASQTDVTATTNTGNIYFTPGAYVNLPSTFSPEQGETGHLIYTVSEDMTATELEQEFGKCTAIFIKDGATLNLDKALTLANLQMVTLNGGKVNLPAKTSDGKADFVQQVKSFAVYVYGESEISGGGTLQWANDNTNNKIVVKSKAYFKNSAKLVNFNAMTVEAGDATNKTIVENPGTISGATAPDLTGNCRWIGNAFETKAYDNPND